MNMIALEINIIFHSVILVSNYCQYKYNRQSNLNCHVQIRLSTYPEWLGEGRGKVMRAGMPKFPPCLNY